MAADAVFTTLEACVGQVDEWVSRPRSSAETPRILPDAQQEQLAAVRDLGLASARDRRFDEISRKVAQAFEAPISCHPRLAPPARGVGRVPDGGLLVLMLVGVVLVISCNAVAQKKKDEQPEDH